MAPRLELPYDITRVTPEEDRIIKRCLKGHTTSFVRCGKPGYVMPGSFVKCAEAIYNLKVRPDDVWIITFPRSGTTWTQELIWLAENNLDYETAKSIPLHERFPMLDDSMGGLIAKSDFFQTTFGWRGLNEIGVGGVIKETKDIKMYITVFWRDLLLVRKIRSTLQCVADHYLLPVLLRIIDQERLVYKFEDHLHTGGRKKKYYWK
ncbi:hypothetical protein evm_013316 [Chilo suppressalis]|nr:hypothetical protein evm_013316 [Chilo suppressalis]